MKDNMKYFLSENELEQRAEAMSKAQFDEAAHEKSKILLLNFSLAGELYGIDMLKIEEVISLRQKTFIPYMPEFIKGMINFRGNPVLLADMRSILGLEFIEYTSESRILIINWGDMLTGIVIDGINRIIEIPLSAFKPVKDSIQSVKADYIKGVAQSNEKIIILLNIENVLKEISERLKQK